MGIALTEEHRWRKEVRDMSPIELLQRLEVEGKILMDDCSCTVCSQCGCTFPSACGCSCPSHVDDDQIY